MMFSKNLIVLLAMLVSLVGFNLMEGCGGGGETTGSDVMNEQSGQDGLETEMVNEIFNPFCAKDKECDDKIDCTVDACLQGNCSHVPDNNKCGTGEVCEISKGGCVKAKSCFSDADCKDKLKCTVEGCDQQTHLCQQIYDDSRCPQGYICFSPVDFDNDGEGSTDEEYSGCLPTSRCQGDADCLPDESSCAVGKCVAEICVYAANSAKCDNGDMCDGQEFCQADEYACGFSGENDYYGSFPEYCNKYQCHQAENWLTCDDKNYCTDDWCDQKKGCIYENNNAPCEDGEICTKDDKCSNGICVSGPLLTCDDKNPCTKDYCKEGTPSNCYNNQYDTLVCQDILSKDTWADYGADAEIIGCNHKPDPAMDGEFCETPCLKDGICSAGKCSTGAPVDCDDKNPCTEDWCDSVGGCKSKIVVVCDSKEQCCYGSCCTSEQVCYNNYCCSPDCVDKNCGDDGCGGSCGACGANQTCSNNKCICLFTPCANKCCLSGQNCFNNQCCTPNCVDKECGDDGCGGSCGKCTQFPNSFCDSGTCKCNNQCTGKECGDDGCGESCGECNDKKLCTEDYCESNKCVFQKIPTCCEFPTEWAPASYLNQIQIVTTETATLCKDFNGDNKPDNGYGALASCLNGPYQENIDKGNNIILLEFVNVSDFQNDTSFTLNQLKGIPKNKNPFTFDGELYVDKDSYYNCSPTLMFNEAKIVSSQFTTTPASFFSPLPIFPTITNMELLFLIKEVEMKGTITSSSGIDGITIAEWGTLTGKVFKDDIMAAFDALDQYCQSCEPSNPDCLTPPDECNYIALIKTIAPSLMDLDCDGKPKNCMSICIKFSGQKIKIIGYPPL